MLRKILGLWAAILIACGPALAPAPASAQAAARVPVVFANPDPYPSALVALDFIGASGSPFYKSAAINCRGVFTCLPGLSVSRASTGYAEDASGVLRLFATGQARITNKGLLVEEARTNSLLWSQDFTAANWTALNTTITANQDVAPDGTLTADLMVGASAASASKRVGQSSTITGTQAFSVYAKAAGWNFLQLAQTSDANGFADFDLSTCTVGTVGSAVTATATPSANGYCRITTVYNLAAATGLWAVYLAPSASATFGAPTTTTAGAYLWQADNQLGAFNTSPILTTTVAATRALDVIILSAAGLETTGATAVAQWVDPSGYGGVSRRVFDRNSTGFFTMQAINGAGSVNASIVGGGAAQAAVTLVPGITHRMAASFSAAGAINLNYDGGVTASASGVAMAAGIGFVIGGGASSLNGYVQSLIIYPSVLSTTQLQQLAGGTDQTSLDLNFAAGSYKLTSTGTRTTDFSSLAGVSVVRASQGYAETASGALVSFGNNVARITNKGLLVEEARTNLLLWSQDYTNAAWNKLTNGGTGVAPVATANAGAAPDGTSTASRVQFSLAGGTTTADISRIRQVITTSAGTNSYTFYIRSTDGVSTYNMTAEDSAGPTSPITVTGAWRRITLTNVAGAGSTGYGLMLRGGQTPTNADTADVLVWGADVEVGTFATSYIATTAASASRVADVVSLGSLSQAGPLSVVAGYTMGHIESPVNRRVFSFLNAGDTARVLAVIGNGSSNIQVANQTVSATTGNSVTVGQPAVVAAAFDTTVKGSLNGGAVTTSAATTNAGPFVTLNLGNQGAASFVNDYIQRIAIYPYAANDNELTYRSAGNW